MVLPPLLRNDAERRAADFGFAEAARGGRHHFLCVRDVGDIGRHAAAAKSRARIQAVHLHAALVVAPAGASEHRHLRRDLNVRRAAAGGDDAGNQQRRGGPRTRGRDGRHQLIADRGLTSDALRVDDGRLAADRDGFRDAAHLQVGVDRRVETAGQLDVLAPDRAEPGQRERHRILARQQVDDAVLPRAVSDSRARLFDEHRARGFHGDAGQHGAGGVLDHAADRRLRISRRREDDEYGQQEQDPSQAVHVLSFERASGPQRGPQKARATRSVFAKLTDSRNRGNPRQYWRGRFRANFAAEWSEMQIIGSNTRTAREPTR